MNNICIEIKNGEIVCVSSNLGHPLSVTIVDYDQGTDVTDAAIVTDPDGYEAPVAVSFGQVARDPEKIQKLNDQFIEGVPSYKEAVETLAEHFRSFTH